MWHDVKIGKEDVDVVHEEVILFLNLVLTHSLTKGIEMWNLVAIDGYTSVIWEDFDCTVLTVESKDCTNVVDSGEPPTEGLVFH